jgi:hypothetical protein
VKRSPLRARPPADRRSEPGYVAWHAPVYGECAVCGKRDRLVRHHVVLQQHVRALGADPWDLRNSILIGSGFACSCHRSHHVACRRLPLDKVPDAAIVFAVLLLGEERAQDYLGRYYLR